MNTKSGCFISRQQVHRRKYKVYLHQADYKSIHAFQNSTCRHPFKTSSFVWSIPRLNLSTLISNTSKVARCKQAVHADYNTSKQQTSWESKPSKQSVVGHAHRQHTLSSSNMQTEATLTNYRQASNHKHTQYMCLTLIRSRISALLHL